MSIHMVSLCFTFLLSIRPASAVLAPNMTSCNLPSDLPVHEISFNCCVPSAHYPLRLFKPNFSSTSSSLCVRRPAHAVDLVYADKLARAYALMKALPADDPRSFAQQANIHCAYCNMVYNQMNSSQLFQIHGTWLFFPFHRWYLYFHERILAKLLGDDDFALPFWNYDHPDGATIPWLYSTYNLTLLDHLRDTLHHASAPAAIDYGWDTENRSLEQQLRENANSLFRGLIRDTITKEMFFGGAYRQGDSSPHAYGTVERRPHNTVHLWVGQKTQVGWKDMGSLYAAARDPIFYAHHALIDRLWEVWKAMPGHYDIEAEDYLEAEFAFYNEDAELVRVRVADALSTTEMGYVYEEVENVWMEAIPERRSAGAVQLTGNERMCVEGEAMEESCSIVMQRNLEGAVMGKEEHMEFLFACRVNEPSQVDIYINMPSANAETDSGCEEYYDFVTVVPISENATTITVSTSRGLLKARLAALELSESTSLVVTLVPRPFNASHTYLALLHASIVTADSYIFTI